MLLSRRVVISFVPVCHPSLDASFRRSSGPRLAAGVYRAHPAPLELEGGREEGPPSITRTRAPRAKGGRGLGKGGRGRLGRLDPRRIRSKRGGGGTQRSSARLLLLSRPRSQVLCPLAWTPDSFPQIQSPVARDKGKRLPSLVVGRPLCTRKRERPPRRILLRISQSPEEQRRRHWQHDSTGGAPYVHVAGPAAAEI